jgi:hypothetical protein
LIVKATYIIQIPFERLALKSLSDGFPFTEVTTIFAAEAASTHVKETLKK